MCKNVLRASYDTNHMVCMIWYAIFFSSVHYHILKLFQSFLNALLYYFQRKELPEMYDIKYVENCEYFPNM